MVEFIIIVEVLFTESLLFVLGQILLLRQNWERLCMLLKWFKNFDGLNFGLNVTLVMWFIFYLVIRSFLLGNIELNFPIVLIL